MKRYDAIVAGAGPAGSSCAYRLATAGASVLLLDRARFPRDKPCGGGVTGRAEKLLPVGIEPVVEHVVRQAVIRLGYRRSVTRGSGPPLVLMTQRRRLDELLASRAAEAGADFRDGVRVTAVEIGEGGAVVATEGGERYEAETLVGADGANGIAAKALGLGGNQEVGVGLEANVPWEKLDPGPYRGTLVLELGTVPGGYGWVFPKGDHANLGVGGFGREGPALRGFLRKLCTEHGVLYSDLESVRGHRLPMRSARSTLARGRALIVGDAAGLIDPLSGDGMFEAFLSSQVASEAVFDVLAGRQTSLESYGQVLTRRLATHLWASWSAKSALERFPRLTYSLMQSRPVWGVIEKLLRGELADVAAVRGIARQPLKAIAVLAHAAGDPGRAYREPRAESRI